MTREQELLSECSKVLDSSKTWGGMGWTLHPIHPIRYRKLKETLDEYWNEKQKEHDAQKGQTP